MTIKAIIFDAYGTLFDVHTVVDKCEQFFPGKGRKISEIWRQKQLEYTWLRSLMGRYEDFWSVTHDALIFALKELKVDLNEQIHMTLLDQYLRLNPYPEVPNALEKLKNRKLAILSNGSTDMLNTVVENAGLSHVFTHVISVDELKIYKPFMGVYQLGVAKLWVNKEETLFITSNPWDASGAKTFGFQVCWINRFNKQFDELGVQPNMILKNLDQLVDRL
ncbi:haloacid dehalogenase type II [Aneurinibacillus terranovensis]|uniref:haloacid dehalogenase type II n=1 Tax=Aneurinibacillus terranovensis TaxID=278991 RepID=UPI0003FCAD7F|nr:haloacid dehalogenase type II [Aneurinibacillus terranovensis]